MQIGWTLALVSEALRPGWCGAAQRRRRCAPLRAALRATQVLHHIFCSRAPLRPLGVLWRYQLFFYPATNEVEMVRAAPSRGAGARLLA